MRRFSLKFSILRRKFSDENKICWHLPDGPQFRRDCPLSPCHDATKVQVISRARSWKMCKEGEDEYFDDLLAAACSAARRCRLSPREWKSRELKHVIETKQQNAYNCRPKPSIPLADANRYHSCFPILQILFSFFRPSSQFYKQDFSAKTSTEDSYRKMYNVKQDKIL